MLIDIRRRGDGIVRTIRRSSHEHDTASFFIRTKRAHRMKAGAKKRAFTMAVRARLRRRVQQMYQGLNAEKWPECFSLIDPRLRNSNRVVFDTWAETVKEFMRVYGRIIPRFSKTYLHLDEESRQDPRPFAYVYVVWQDASGAFHMFRERWVEEQGKWYTRVAGLVAVRSSGSANRRQLD